MKEYIEKEALKAQFAADGWLKERLRASAYCRATKIGYVKERTVEQVIDSIPPVDVKPVVRGEWIWEEASWGYRCSACRIMFDYDKTYELFDHGYQFANFCPHCGADMRKVEN